MKFDIVAGHNVKDAEGNVWVWDRRHNLIGYFAKDSFDFHIAGKFEKKIFSGFGMFLRRDVIYITSQYKLEILAYTRNDNLFRLFESDILLKASQYYSAELNEEKIIMFSYELGYGSIIFDITRGCFEKGPILKTDQCYNAKTISRLLETEQKIIITVSNSNSILVIDKKNMSYSELQIPGMDDIGGICVDGVNCLWAISKNGEKLIQYSSKENFQIIAGEKKEGDLFSKLLKYEKKIIAIPRNANEVYICDTSKKKIELIPIPMNVERMDNKTSLFWDCYVRDNILVLLPWGYPNIVEVNLDALGIKVGKVNVTDNEFIMYGLSEILYETEEINLTSLLEIMRKQM